MSRLRIINDYRVNKKLFKLGTKKKRMMTKDGERSFLLAAVDFRVCKRLVVDNFGNWFGDA